MIKNGLYNGITSILNIALGILVIPVLIRTMGLDAYGLWIYATAVIGIVELAEMGLSVSTTYFVSKDLANRDSRSLSETLSIICGLVLIVATIGGVAVWLLAAPIAHLAANLNPEQQDQATYIIRLGAFVVWVAMVQRVLIGIQQAFHRYDLLNLIASTQAITVYLSMLAVAFAGGGPEQLMVAYLVVTGMAFVANSIAVRYLLRPYATSICWNQQRVPVIARYSLSTWFISLGSALFSKGDRILVGAVAGTAVLGAYGAITSVVSKINQLSAAVVQPLLPSISGLSARENGANQELIHHYRQAVELNALVSFGLSGVLLLLAPILSFVIVDQQSEALVNSFILASIIYGLYSLGAVPWYTLIARGRTMTVLRINLLAAIVSLLLVTVGAIQYGLIGAIAGNMGYLLILLLYIFAAHNLNIRPGSFGFWKGHTFFWYLAVVGLSIIVPTILAARISVAVVASLLLIWLTPLAKELIMSLPLLGSRVR
jgi:O-antigen/teichoic acid export membrane protein